MARNSIPVPNRQRQQQQQQSSSRQTAAAVNQASRDQQPPWRSSLLVLRPSSADLYSFHPYLMLLTSSPSPISLLPSLSDLVWSYSRSQAFYGDNIGTSPSFVDRHWAGPPRHDENGNLTEDSLDEYDEDEEEDGEYLDDHSGTEADSIITQDEDEDPETAGRMEWEGEQLPRNALGSGIRSGGSNSNRRRRNSGRRRDSNSSGQNPRNRRISKLEDEENDSEERSRSRSRSPKRLGNSNSNSNRGSHLNPYRSSEDGKSGLKIDRSSSSSSNSSNLSSRKAPNEGTPLLETGRKPSNGFLDSNKRSYSGASVNSSGYKSALRTKHGQGTSTFLQSWFNSLNALVGVGIL